ncbi:VVA0879 family protein [Alkalihalobacillus sp. AL-G]|uniref:VVA0879 family protein n=1 Tax=Alkalihalobacillus sp. AL-G TaxID=2926399 RepID=UPI00272AF59E|nr:VVA0879 family protein [Alkalihalobacillus sp. AL-G]WLD94755.1 transcription elongation factor 1 family protein [Alkalihalobacillus sp. AL-G]
MEKYTVVEWETKGVMLFGKEKRNWYFKCPNCFWNQSVEEILKDGYQPNMAYVYCRNCNYHAEKGTFGKGKLVAVDPKQEIEIFDFA